jgi:hypothetical protein
VKVVHNEFSADNDTTIRCMSHEYIEVAGSNLTVGYIMELQNMEDNRRQRRIPLSTAAQVAKLGSGDRIEAELVNISNYGASLKTTVPLQSNERVKVSMTLNKRNHFVHSEEVPGTVRYVNSTKGNDLAGIKFNIKISDSGFPKFNQCLDYLKTH